MNNYLCKVPLIAAFKTLQNFASHMKVKPQRLMWCRINDTRRKMHEHNTMKRKLLCPLFAQKAKNRLTISLSRSDTLINCTLSKALLRICTMDGNEWQVAFPTNAFGLEVYIHARSVIHKATQLKLGPSFWVKNNSFIHKYASTNIWFCVMC